MLEQVNPGVPDLENGWHDIGRVADLDAALDELARSGWVITERPATRQRG